MNKRTSFVNLLLEESSFSFDYLSENMGFLEESRLFQNVVESSEISDVVYLINTKLHNAGNTRLSALLLLEKFLPQCPSNVFTDYSPGWMEQCCKWNLLTIKDELRILNELVRKSISNQDLKKQIGSHVLPRFVDQLINIQESQNSVQIVINKLKCIKSFIQFYSSSCGSHKGVFYKYTMFCLKQYPNNNTIISEAATCFISLCECGTKGQQNVNFKESWAMQFQSLLDTAHSLFDLIYSCVNFVEMTSVERSGKSIQALLSWETNSDTSPVRRFNEYRIRFSVIAELLKAMLLCKFSGPKSIFPNDVLNLICRILSVNFLVLDQCIQNNDIITLKANLPKLHILAFEILNALIVCAKQNLISESSFICKLCLQSLKWTQASDWDYGTSKPFSALRCKVYSVFSTWLSVAGSSSSVEFFVDDLLPLVIADIEYTKPTLKLTVTTTAKNKKCKRKRSYPVTEMNMQNSSNVLVDETANYNVCSAAHEVMQLILECASVLIKWEHHKKVQYCIIPIMLEILDSPSETTYPLPYSILTCRFNLFKTLVTLMNHPHPKWTSPLTLGVRILTLGIKDTSPTVAAFCKAALGQLEGIIHPRCSTLYFPLEAVEKDITGKTTNWPLLEAPFGKDSVSSEEVKDDSSTTSHHTQITNNNEVAQVVSSNSSSTVSSVINHSLVIESKQNSSQTRKLSDEQEAASCEASQENLNGNPSEELANVHIEKEKASSIELHQSTVTFQSRFAPSNSSFSIPEVQENDVENEGEPPVKKSKDISMGDVINNEELQSMLNDFVDTLV